MRRILVIGPCGSGKSTLAGELAGRLNLPLHHLDAIAWLPGWIEMERPAFQQRLREIVAGESWVIDGCYGSTLDLRAPRADTIVYLDYPISLCLWRLVKRTLRYRGTTRPDMGEDCPERFDAEFFWYVMRWNSGPRIRLHKRLEGHWHKVLRLKSPAQTAQWLDAIAQG